MQHEIAATPHNATPTGPSTSWWRACPFGANFVAVTTPLQGEPLAPTLAPARKPPSAKQLAWRETWGKTWSAIGHEIKQAHTRPEAA